MGPCPPKFLEHTVILYFERLYPKQDSVIRIKSNILAPQIFGLATLLPSSVVVQHHVIVQDLYR